MCLVYITYKHNIAILESLHFHAVQRFQVVFYSLNKLRSKTNGKKQLLVGIQLNTGL